jgi:hypothetical protein
MKAIQAIFIAILSVAQQISCSPEASVIQQKTRNIAGVDVVDTPIVQNALQHARKYADELTYKHYMRAWLLGTILIQKNPKLNGKIDMEVHALGTILHDLGWDETGRMVSKTRRFEVDSAIEARNFIRSHPNGKDWDERRVQMVWDAIALHGERSILNFKEDVVKSVNDGMMIDFAGPTMSRGAVSKAQWDAINKMFPREGFKTGFTKKIIWLCQTKPESTYGNYRLYFF